MKLVAVAMILVSFTPTLIIGKGPLIVTLFYESYCPDCIQYIEDKLHPAWSSFKNHVLFDLVPFGNAQQSHESGHWEFHCQHGPKECLGNKLHACAIYQACDKVTSVGCAVSQLDKVMEYLFCVLRTRDQSKATEECAQTAGLKAEDIVTCANSELGDKLLNYFGNQTQAFHPAIEYVPTVALNGKHDTSAEDDLVGEICKLRPNLCSTASPEVVNV